MKTRALAGLGLAVVALLAGAGHGVATDDLGCGVNLTVRR